MENVIRRSADDSVGPLIGPRLLRCPDQPSGYAILIGYEKTDLETYMSVTRNQRRGWLKRKLARLGFR
jgi:hypothetical protein